MRGRLFVGLAMTACAAVAQTPESLAGWKYYQELTSVPEMNLVLLDLPVDALDGGREDLADLRLYDASGHEVPYALRVRREIHESEAFEAREINRGERGDVAEVTLDLGEDAAAHNEIEVNAAGEDFRRRVTVEGSDGGEQWLTLEGRALIFRFSSQGRGVDQRTVEYSESDYRYLRVRVEADRQIETAAPRIESVTVRRLTRSPGVEQAFPAGAGIREAGRDQGRPASIYRIELYGRIPLHGLNLMIGEAPFSRPYRLETDGEENQRSLLASGTLKSEEQGGSEEMRLRFAEQFAERLALTVIDDRNPPLNVFGGSAVNAARQVLFNGEGLALPLKLYYGNPGAAPPNYDFDSTVGLTPPEGILPTFANGEQENPDYRPPEQPLTERAPWAIYVVLAAASLAILGLLRKVLAGVGAET
jgi:hypothetical protein